MARVTNRTSSPAPLVALTFRRSTSPQTSTLTTPRVFTIARDASVSANSPTTSARYPLTGAEATEVAERLGDEAADPRVTSRLGR